MQETLLNLPSLMLLESSQGTFWFPPQGSTMSDDVDMVFKLMFWICTAFFIVIMAVTLLFIVKYRHRPGHTAQQTPTHSTKLEITWSLLPTTLLAVIFIFATEVYFDLVDPPRGTVMEIKVKAQRWLWDFEYPNSIGKQPLHMTELHVPKGVPVKLVMRAEANDVLHSLFIPAFRVKQDVMPGRYATVWFIANEATWVPIKDSATPEEIAKLQEENNKRAYDLFCTEYCGTGHSNMITKVHVHDTDFKHWHDVELDGGPGPWDEAKYLKVGKNLFEVNCTQCHRIDGTSLKGPALNGIWGKDEPVTVTATKEKTTRKVDADYIERSLHNPQAEIRQGFETEIMTPFPHIVDNNLTAITRYIESLKDK